jgi:hypothetical protein
MRCSRCGDHFHKAPRCALPADASEEVRDRAYQEASARWDVAWRAVHATHGVTTRPLIMEELRRMFPPTKAEPVAPIAEHAQRAFDALQRELVRRKSIAATVPAEAEQLAEIASPRRTVVIVHGGDCTRGFNSAFGAASRGDSNVWHVVAADGLAAGVRTAIALQADHVVLCVGEKLDKSTLKPWIQRLRSIHGLQVIAVYDSRMKQDELDDEIEALDLDHWIGSDGAKDYLERTIARWEPSESKLKPPASWMPSPLRVVN